MVRLCAPMFYVKNFIKLFKKHEVGCAPMNLLGYVDAHPNQYTITNKTKELKRIRCALAHLTWCASAYLTSKTQRKRA